MLVNSDSLTGERGDPVGQHIIPESRGNSSFSKYIKINLQDILCLHSLNFKFFPYFFSEFLTICAANVQQYGVILTTVGNCD